MTKTIPALALLASLTLLPACATGYATTGASYHEGYYDNYYGPVRAGYWGPDGYFYYRTDSGYAYVRDDSRHFRRDRGEGESWSHFRMRHDPPPRSRP